MLTQLGIAWRQFLDSMERDEHSVLSFRNSIYNKIAEWQLGKDFLATIIGHEEEGSRSQGANM